MLTARELEQLRNDILETLPDTCTILRQTTSNSGGYSSATWGTAVASAVCRVDPAPNASRTGGMVADKEAGITNWQLTLAYNTDIADGDRIRHGGLIYEVKQVFATHSLNAVRRATLAKVG